MSSDAKRNLFPSISKLNQAVQNVAPGLKDFVPQVKAEFSRLGTQGAMEIASLLFNGSGFVPYGPGQYTPSAEQSNEPQGHQHEHGGMER